MTAFFYNQKTKELIYQTDDIYIKDMNKEHVTILISDEEFENSEEIDLFITGDYVSDNVCFSLPEPVIKSAFNELFVFTFYIKYE